ncbi:MAG: FecR family protein [Bacteroidetes bacterium]|nr:FecR family protein [Bacteroidota bacterium]
MNEERIWLLLSLKLSGEATVAELAELEAILKEHPGIAAKSQAITALWQHQPQQQEDAAGAQSFNRHLQRLSNQLSAPALQYEAVAEQQPAKIIPVRSNRKWYWVAAASIAAVVLSFFFFDNNKTSKQAKPAENTVSTKPGSKSKVQLPDGTEVWLNADSKLEYNENFNVKLREVKLTGEAFFDVVKNKEKPFIIHTAQMDVKVTGTAFNVRSYPDEPTTETALIRGAVEISLRSNPEKKYYLKPNDKLVLNNNITAAETADQNNTGDSAGKEMVKMKKVNVNREQNDITETMWVKNKLAFDNEPLEKILAETERWYNVEIQLNNDNAKEVHFTGVFENKPLTDVLEALCLSSHLHYQVKGNKVTVF